MQRFNKAVAAIIGGLISLVTLLGLPLPEVFKDPAVVASITGVISTLLVVLAPANKQGGGGGP